MCDSENTFCEGNLKDFTADSKIGAARILCAAELVLLSMPRSDCRLRPQMVCSEARLSVSDSNY